ncbi:ABC transporter ATP-binding protein [Brevibacterium sp.]|uniref:ABC transporter ATP-binding protein n=1 Tax=Brevibacterium sp. TaxID=1701 RepID=UPI0025C65691|nr:ABC transporter ATP-binding protein [Brevibacterium sp.]
MKAVGPDSTQGASRRSTTRWLVSQTRTLLAPLVLSALARIVSQLLGVGLLVVTASALLATAASAQSHALRLAAVLVVMALAKAGLRYAEHYAGHWVAFTSLQRLRELFFARLIPQAPAATKGRAGAALTETATQDIDRIEVFFAHTFPPAVSALVVPAVVLLWLGTAADAALAWLLVPFVVLALLLPLLSARTVWTAADSVAEGRGQVAAHVGDDVAGVREVLHTGAEEARLAGLDSAGRALTRARSHSGRIEGVRAGLLELVQTAAVLTVLVTGVANGAEAEAVVLTLAAAVGLRGPVSGVDGFAAGLDSALASAQRLRRIVEAPPAVVDAAGAALPARTGPPAARPARPTVEFRGVTFRHGPREVLHDVDLVLPDGEWSYVAGVSGSGKSTLASLLLRDWDPETGAVLLGGEDVSGLPLEQLRSRVAIVDQRPTLLADTVDANLRLAAPHADPAQVQTVLAAVGLKEWAAELPDGLATVLAAGRSQVSGGQLQRLALARALLAQPEVLVLDEALSQLDADTAAHVREQLHRLRPGATTVEITHRVDLVEPSARVAVIDAGRLVETGTAAELRSRGGAFARLLARTAPA